MVQDLTSQTVLLKSTLTLPLLLASQQCLTPVNCGPSKGLFPEFYFPPFYYGNIQSTNLGQLLNLIALRNVNGGRSQDGGGVGRGDHFLFYKFIERTTEW